MDIRLAKILLERGRYHPEVEPLRRPSDLLQEIRAGKVRGKYRRPRDLLRLPRNPAEKAAREDLLLLSELSPYSLRFVKELQKRIVPIYYKREYEKKRELVYVGGLGYV